MPQVGAARSQVDSVQAQLAEAEANARRLSTLVSQQLVSKAQYDQAIAAARLAARPADHIRSATRKVAGDRLRIADLGVDNTIVRAPFAGVVTAKAAQPGEIVSPLAAGGFTRTGIGTIVDMDSLEIEVDVGEAFIGRVQPKMPVEATLNAYPDWKIPAEVIAIIPTADRGKATVKVRVALKTQGPAHRSRHGRARELPGSRQARGAQAEAWRAGAGRRDHLARRQAARLRRRRGEGRAARSDRRPQPRRGPRNHPGPRQAARRSCSNLPLILPMAIA